MRFQKGCLSFFIKRKWDVLSLWKPEDDSSWPSRLLPEKEKNTIRLKRVVHLLLVLKFYLKIFNYYLCKCKNRLEIYAYFSFSFQHRPTSGRWAWLSVLLPQSPPPPPPTPLHSPLPSSPPPPPVRSYTLPITGATRRLIGAPLTSRTLQRRGPLQQPTGALITLRGLPPSQGPSIP